VDAGARTVSWSSAEIAALATKAARGAGAPPLQAARFGQVAVTHLSAGRSEDALRAALEALPDGPILDYALSVDTALEACARGVPALLDQTPRSALLDSYIDALPFAAHIANDLRVPRLKVAFSTPRPQHPPCRMKGCDALVAFMEGLAEGTYVPDTDVSRSSGAGAGLLDND